MRDMELVSNVNQDQKATLENKINLCLLLSDNFHDALRWQPDTLRGIGLLRVGILPHLDVGQLPVTLKEEVQDALLGKIEKILAAISAFQDLMII